MHRSTPVNIGPTVVKKPNKTNKNDDNNNNNNNSSVSIPAILVLFVMAQASSAVIRETRPVLI